MKVKVESMKIVCDCCGETFHDGNVIIKDVHKYDGELLKDK